MAYVLSFSNESLLEQMREQGPDFLEKNAVVADEIRRSLIDLDRIEKGLGKAAKAIGSVTQLVGKHKTKLMRVCNGTGPAKLKKANGTSLPEDPYPLHVRTAKGR